MVSELNDVMAHAIQRGEVTRQVRDCDACSLGCSGIGHQQYKPVPFRGPTPSRLMLLGEAPGHVDARQGKPLAGRSGEAMAIMFAEAGLPTLDRWFIANAVSCLSAKTPGMDEIAACKANLVAQVDLCDPEWILVMGAVPLKAIGIREEVTKIRGRWWTMPVGPVRDRKVFATFHPAAAIRDLRKLTVIGADLSTLATVIGARDGGEEYKVRIGKGGKVVRV